MFEIYGENLLLEFFNVFDDERLATRSPCNDIRVLLVLKNVVCFFNKVTDGLLGFFPTVPHI